MVQMKLRDYQSADYEGVQKLWKLTGVGGSHRGDDQKIIEQSIEMGGKMIVLEDLSLQRIMGTSWITFDGRRLHLHHIAVDPSLQNEGYGKQLTRASLQFARNMGYQIKLEVHQENKNAIHLYEKLGFKRLGDYDVYIIRDLSEI